MLRGMNLVFLLLLAEDTATAMPEWMEPVLGPIGVLVLLLIYAWYTEKKRLPALVEQLKVCQAKKVALLKDRETDLNTLRATHKVEQEELRSSLEGRENAVEEKASKSAAKLAKERGLRIYWEGVAQSLCKQHEEEIPKPPDDVSTTFYGG